MINFLNFADMFGLYLAVLALLFSRINPLGAKPLFFAMTPQHTGTERKKFALHTILYVCIILIAFYSAGSLIIGFFGISKSVFPLMDMPLLSGLGSLLILIGLYRLILSPINYGGIGAIRYCQELWVSS